MRKGGPLLYLLLLILVTAVWGWTFVVVKDAISAYPPLPFLAVRFMLAAAVLAVWVRAWPDPATWKVGLTAGVCLFAGYLTQTLGLARTSPGNAGLITGLFVVFTPIVERFFGHPLPRRTMVAAAVAVAGTALLSTGTGWRLSLGDLMVAGCALAFAFHIVVLSRRPAGLSAPSLALVQMVVCAGLFTAVALPQLRPPPASVWFALVVTGVVASALAFLVQTWAQSRLSASRTAVVLASEPAWAFFFATQLAGQQVNWRQALGAVMLMGAILGHEVISRSRPELRSAEPDPRPAAADLENRRTQ